MAVKLMSVGNILMGDDSIGIIAAEKIKGSLESLDVETIIGETDFYFCNSAIADGDFILILDAVITERGKPGEVIFIPIHECSYNSPAKSQHCFSIIDMLKESSKQVEGYIIGIEIHEIKFSLSLSKTLEIRLEQICEDILKGIRSVLTDKGLLNNI